MLIYTRLLKIYFLVLLSFFLLSCSKEATEPTPTKTENEPGVLGKFLADNPNYLIRKSVDLTNNEFDTEAGYDFRTYTHLTNSHGFAFSVNKKLKLTSLGARIAKTGKYRIELLAGEPFVYTELDMTSVVSDTLTIADVNKFSYKPLTKEVILEPNKSYILRYYSDNFDSIYEVGYPNRYTGAVIPFPIANSDLSIRGNYYSYYRLSETTNTRVFSMSGGTHYELNGYVRGLVDLKYSLVQ